MAGRTILPVGSVVSVVMKAVTAEVSGMARPALISCRTPLSCSSALSSGIKPQHFSKVMTLLAVITSLSSQTSSQPILYLFALASGFLPRLLFSPKWEKSKSRKLRRFIKTYVMKMENLAVSFITTRACNNV